MSGFRLLAALLFCLGANARASTPKEWTLLIFLNGHNDLDTYGTANINQMEKVGSNDDVNVVVQWASLKNPTTKRLYIQKDADPAVVNSPVVQDLPRVDMGDYRQLDAFIEWTVEKYPAKKYFVVVWNHGTGWHRNRPPRLFRDISEDDLSKNVITTEQMGLVMDRMKRLIGKKVDILAHDACLMSMLEVVNEFRDTVQYHAGSEDLVPAAGWPYDKILERWLGNRGASPEWILKVIGDEYVKLFEKDPEEKEVTFSAIRMDRIAPLQSLLRRLSRQVLDLPETDLRYVHEIAKTTKYFDHPDYLDLLQFLNRLGERSSVDRSLLGKVVEAHNEAVFYKVSKKELEDTGGLSFWFPKDRTLYNRHIDRYKKLSSDLDNEWSNALDAILSAKRKR